MCTCSIQLARPDPIKLAYPAGTVEVGNNPVMVIRLHGVEYVYRMCYVTFISIQYDSILFESNSAISGSHSETSV